MAGTAGRSSPALLSTLQQFEDLLEALTEVSDYGLVTELVRALVGVDAVSVVDTSGHQPRVVAGSPHELAELARVVDGVAGPSMVASRSETLVRCPDLTTWPDAAAADATSGLRLRSVAAIPLVARGRSLGVLSLYLTTVRDWSEDELALGRLAARLIALHLDHSATVHTQKILTGQLQTALDSRVVIEQAKGVIAASEGISVDEAFARMRSRARRTNRKLVEVASEVVAGWAHLSA